MESIKKQMEVIFNITGYSMKMFFRDRTAIYFSLFIPLLIMTIFGLLNFDRGAKVNLGVVDMAENQVSKQVTESLKKIETLNIHESKNKESEIDEIKKSSRDLVLVLPKDFGANIAAFQMQKATGRTAQIETQNIEVYENENKTNTNVQIGLTILDKVFDGFTHQVSGTPNLFTLEQKTVEAKKRSYIDFIVPGVAAMSVMQMSVFGVVGAIVSWRERGILKRLLATPIRQSNIIFSQVATRLTITLMQVAVLISIGVLIFKMTIVGNIFLVFLTALLGGIVFLSMGFALSAAASTQNTVMALGNLIIMPQMFLSGVFFPRESLPDWLNKVTAYFPLTYLSDAMREIMINGANMWQIRADLIGLFVWGLILFFIASRTFRWE